MDKDEKDAPISDGIGLLFSLTYDLSMEKESCR
jgi:hypothetical protein